MKWLTVFLTFWIVFCPNCKKKQQYVETLYQGTVVADTAFSTKIIDFSVGYDKKNPSLFCMFYTDTSDIQFFVSSNRRIVYQITDSFGKFEIPIEYDKQYSISCYNTREFFISVTVLVQLNTMP